MGITFEKLKQAGELLGEFGLDVWLLFDRETSGGGDPALPLILEGSLTWQSALMVGKDGRRVAVVGNFDAGPLEASGDWTQVIPYVQSVREPLLEALESLTSGIPHPRICVNYSTNDEKADGLSYGMYLLLQDYLRGTRFESSLVSAEKLVVALRGRKTAAEVERMRAAIGETDRLFGEIGAFAKVGVSEREIYDYVHGLITSRGFGFAWDPTGDPIVNAGPESMIGHGIPSADIRIQPGHILHIDLGIRKEGYCSDIQRCWFAGADSEIPEDVLRALDTVNGAINAGADALTPGAEGWEVDAAARRFIVDAGYPEYMHALGHQVGRMAHDGGGILGPQWERYGRTPYLKVESEHVYTVELGVMVEGRGYLGIEEMALVTDSGIEWLTDRQLAMPIIEKN
jgi:Xaa-Pro aminopeptidase